MDIPVGLGGINILVGVAVLFPFVMFLNFCHIIKGGQILVTGKGTVDSVISGHTNQLLSVVRQTAGGRDALPAGSVITHYDTFIPKGCKVPWALRGGMRHLRMPCRL